MMFRVVLFLFLMLFGSIGCSEGAGESTGIETVESLLQFGDVPVGATEEKSLSVRNSGTRSVKLSAERLPRGYWIGPDGAWPIEIRPSATVELKVLFTPDEIGRFDGELVLVADGGRGGSVSVAVMGEGASGDLIVPGTLDFGVVPLGVQASLSLSLHNRSSRDLRVALELPRQEGNFRVEADEILVPALGQAETEVVFSPLEEGIYSSILQVQVCEGCAELRVVLRGEGRL